MTDQEMRDLSLEVAEAMGKNIQAIDTGPRVPGDLRQTDDGLWLVRDGADIEFWEVDNPLVLAEMKAWVEKKATHHSMDWSSMVSPDSAWTAYIRLGYGATMSITATGPAEAVAFARALLKAFKETK